MKSTYVKALSEDNKNEFPFFAKFIKIEDAFWGGIVVFHEERAFTVFHVPNNKNCVRKIGEYCDYAVSCYDAKSWQPINGGTITIEL